MHDLLAVTGDGLACPRGGFVVDPWEPVDVAVLTHAHGDHARPGSGRILCAAPSAPLLRRRLGEDAPLEPVPYGETVRLGDCAVSLHPAGHVLGSAQVRVACDGEVWVVTGDFKRQPDPTCAPFEPLRCDVLITESTYALPIFRWEPAAAVLEAIETWWQRCREEGRTAVLACYALGKAQRIVAGLAALTDRPVHAHGAVIGISEAYREAGVALPEILPVEDGADLLGALVLAPPSALGTPWMRRFRKPSTAFASGAMHIRGSRRWRNHERGFALSDHADWPALEATVRESGARRVLVTHGHAAAFARWLRERHGLDAAAIAIRWEGA